MPNSRPLVSTVDGDLPFIEVVGSPASGAWLNSNSSSRDHWNRPSLTIVGEIVDAHVRRHARRVEHERVVAERSRGLPGRFVRLLWPDRNTLRAVREDAGGAGGEKEGLLVTSLAAFTKYQHENAWTWEHQALTRARYVAGADPADPDLSPLYATDLAGLSPAASP